MKNNNFKTRTRVLAVKETINGAERIVGAEIILNNGSKEITLKHNLRHLSPEAAELRLMQLSVNALKIHYVTESLLAWGQQ